jgi:hypothetical protein
VAADRRLTYPDGRIHHDNTCKLVSLCGGWGISYTGFALLQGSPTHQWIAGRLAEKACQNPYMAAQILAAEAAAAFSSAPFLIEQTFLISGWNRFSDTRRLEPHFLLITNTLDPAGEVREAPAPEFSVFERRLKDREAYVGRVIGSPLGIGRGKHLDRFFRRDLKKGSSPRPAMRAFVYEIVSTPTRSVGDRVLAFRFRGPQRKRSIEPAKSCSLQLSPIWRAPRSATSTRATRSCASMVRRLCGESAFTDVETESDPTRAYQSSSFRLLHVPKRREQ